jgi:hypothetical protein
MSAYVKVITPKQLNLPVAKLLFNTVESTLPSGMISTTSMAQGTGTKATRFFCHRTKGGQYAYVIPLVRNMDLSEAHALLKAWCKAYPQGDFVMDWSQTSTLATPTPTIESTRLDQIIDEWCKNRHRRWMEDLISRGWHLGIHINAKQKTHPWLQPWEQLPQAAKDKDLDSVRDLLNIFKNYGFQITQTPIA